MPVVTDEAFIEFCADYPDERVEVSADGEWIVSEPSYTLDGVRNSAIGSELQSWAHEDGRGVVCGASASFTLPSGARRSPDSSWTHGARIEALEPRDREGFWTLCPDFVIELCSGNESSQMLRAKMVEYMENGAQLGWLIEPEARKVTVYRPGAEPEEFTKIGQIAGEGPVAGFVLALGPVWDPLAP